MTSMWLNSHLNYFLIKLIETMYLIYVKFYKIENTLFSFVNIENDIEETLETII